MSLEDRHVWASKLARAIAETRFRESRGFVTHATCKKHEQHLLARAEDTGVRPLVEQILREAVMQ